MSGFFDRDAARERHRVMQLEVAACRALQSSWNGVETLPAIAFSTAEATALLAALAAQKGVQA